MDYFLTDEQKEIRNLSRKIAQEKIEPIAIEYDEKGEFAWEIIEILGKSDLCGLCIDEKYGGLGGGVFEHCLVTEELSKACAGIALSIAATALGASPISLSGSEDQKERYLPDIAKGKKLAAFAITEADAGSDVIAMQTTARREGDFYILNGTKQWITNAGEAEIYVVIAMTNKSKGARGASAFIVEKGFHGISFGKKENKMGIRSSATREVILDDCKVPKENLLGGEGKGFIISLKNFDHSRPGVGAQAIGIAQGALDKAVQYAKEREQFGSPISSFQGIQFMLADMATQIEAARALVYSVARAIDSGQKGFSKESAMSKLFASDMAMKVTTDAVQIFGGYGYMKEYPVEKMMRDAKVTQIYEGTNQIQRNIIAQALIKEAARKK